jgi:nucleotide-binding universal stress UspA family protein
VKTPDLPTEERHVSTVSAPTVRHTEYDPHRDSEHIPAPEPPGRIVVGTDGSESSKSALRWAVFLGNALGCDVRALAAWEPSDAWAAAGWTTVPVNWDPGPDTAQRLRETVHEVFGEQLPSNLSAGRRQGSAAKVLLDASRNARMLVVGSRGHGGLAGLVLGSVSSACAEHATCPVLVVHADTPPPPAR